MTAQVQAPGARRSGSGARSTRPDPAPGGPLPLVVAGVLAGAGAAAIGLVILSVPVVVAWLLAPDMDQPWPQMLEVAAGAWLAGQGLPPRIDGITLGLLPLGLAAVGIVSLAVGGRWAGRASAVATLGEALVAAVAGALAYGAVAAVVAALAHDLGIPLTRALATLAPLALLVLLVGVLSGAGLLRDTVRRVPASARATVAAAVVCLALVFAAGALLLGAGLFVHSAEVSALARELIGDLSAALLVGALSIAYLPTAIVWSTAYALGPGVTAAGTSLGEASLPGFPLLAALPDGLPGLALVPASAFLAGAVAGGLLRRRRVVGGPGVLAAIAAAALVGLGMGLAAWLSSGDLGTGRLADLGPDPLACGAWAAGLCGLGMLMVASWPARRSALRSMSSSESQDARESARG